MRYRMKFLYWLMGLGIGSLFVGLVMAEPEDTATSASVHVLEVDGVIGPATSDFIIRGIEHAEESKARLVVIRLNTPGGLDTAMRDIIQKILASQVPVATYVAPSGARAASAGTYILYASHIAAMAPATNLGAATPVQIGPGGGGGDQQEPEKTKDKTPDDRKAGGSAMEKKIINDAVAYIRGLAKLRGRNEQWAEKAVREAASLTASDALEQRVIDFIATDIQELVSNAHGAEVSVVTGSITVDTEKAVIEHMEMDWRSQVLAIITNPNIAYILMLLGMYGLFFELSNPGSIFPGVLGAICLLLALYAFQVLPVNYAGVALILVGMAFIVGEVFVPSFGALGIGGAIAFVVGSVILIDTEVQAFQLSLPLIITVAAFSALFLLIIATLALKQRRKPIVSGKEEMMGSVGEATEAFDTDGRIRIHGELWQAKSTQPVRQGQRVKVSGMDGLVLHIEPLNEEK